MNGRERDDMNNLDTKKPETWWRELCWVTDQICVTGDLNSDRIKALEQLDGWVEAGVTHIADVRAEWSDKAFVNHYAPNMKYLYFPTHDNGGLQSDHWFDHAVDGTVSALAENPQHKVLIHCHMGVNRAPTLALAVLLELGWDALDAMEQIRATRPIAAILYAIQAVDWDSRRIGLGDEQRQDRLDQVGQWLTENRVDVRWIISRIRGAGNSQPRAARITPPFRPVTTLNHTLAGAADIDAF